MQALCNEVFRDNPPRRMVNGGLDFRRFDQVLAVLIKHGKVKLYNQDARVNVLGGAQAMEPAADAAMAAAILSSFHEVELPRDVAFVGEVDLGGA
jgi:DNA repair protein RadA/Sms